MNTWNGSSFFHFLHVALFAEVDYDINTSWKNNQKFGIGQFQKEKCFKKSRYTYG